MRGGTARHLLDVVRSTPDIEHHVITPGPGAPMGASGSTYDHAASTELEDRSTVARIAMSRFPLGPSNAIAAWEVHRAIRRVNPDVVHAHSAVGGAIGRVAARWAGVPVIYTPNGIPVGRIAVSAERLLGRATSRFVAVSESEAARARQWRLAPGQRIVVVPNGIDLAVPAPGPDLREAIGVAPGTPLVGTIARLVSQKAPEEFVRAAAVTSARRGDAHFVLIGKGPLQGALDGEVARSGLAGRWHQVHHVENAAATVGQLDVFALLSRFEGGPYAPLEAMRASVPVVVSDVVGNRDVVEDGVSGRVVPFGNPVAAGTAIADLLDGFGRDAMVASARRRLEERFDLGAMGAALARLYKEVASEATRRRTFRLPQPRPSSPTQSPDSRAAR